MTSTIIAGRNHVSDHIRAQRDKYLSLQENPGKQQVGAPLPQKTPRKVLGDLKNSSSTQNSARKPPVLGTPKPAFVPARDSTSKQRERGRGGCVSSAHKVVPQRPANELLSELEHMAPPELEKPDVFTVPSYVKALRSFRPTLSTGSRGQACDSSGDDCLPEPTRPKDRDEDLFAADKCAPPCSPAHLPDLAELDLLLNNL